MSFGCKLSEIHSTLKCLKVDYFRLFGHFSAFWRHIALHIIIHRRTALFVTILEMYNTYRYTQVFEGRKKRQENLKTNGRYTYYGYNNFTFLDVATAISALYKTRFVCKPSKLIYSYTTYNDLQCFGKYAKHQRRDFCVSIPTCMLTLTHVGCRPMIC